MLTAFFGLRDPKAVEGFFKGGRVPLRRNLPRSEARKLYTQLRSVGLICSLEAVQLATSPEPSPPAPAPEPRSEPASQSEPAPAPPPEPTSKTETEPTPAPASAEEENARQPRSAELPKKARRKKSKKPAKQRGDSSTNDSSPSGTGPSGAPAAAPESAASKPPRQTAAPEPEPATQTKRSDQVGSRVSSESEPASEPDSRPMRAEASVAAAAPESDQRTESEPELEPQRLPAKPKAAFGPGPNLFALRPGTSLRNIAALREATQMRSIIAGAVGVALLLLVAVILFRFPIPEIGARPEGPIAVSALPSNELILMTSDALLLHERSGIASERIGAAEVGLRALAPPLLALPDGDLLLNGMAVGGSAFELHRCQLEERVCSTFSNDASVSGIVSAASSYLGDAYFLLGRDGELRRVTSTGEVVASTPVLSPAGVPRVLIEDGLLYLPANEGPLLGVYIPDEGRYGTQLDAIFLLAQSQNEMDAVHDIAFVADTRFALLKDSAGSLHLHRFDNRWGGGQAVPVALGSQSYLIPWRDKLLIADPGSATVRRVAAGGNLEADFASELLKEEAARWESARRQRQLIKQLGVGLPLLLAAFALFAAVLFQCQYRELRKRQGEATALLDPMPAGIRWIKANPALDGALLRLKTTLLVAPLMAGIALLVSGAPLLLTIAVIPPLIGAGLAWRNLEVGKGGYLGVLPDRIIIVDHEGRYFYGERRLLRGSATAVLAPTASLPLHFLGLRNFEIERKTAASLSAEGRLGAAEIAGGLWRTRHPWLLAFLWAAGGWVMAGAVYLALA